MRGAPEAWRGAGLNARVSTAIGGRRARQRVVALPGVVVDEPVAIVVTSIAHRGGLIAGDARLGAAWAGDGVAGTVAEVARVAICAVDALSGGAVCSESAASTALAPCSRRARLRPAHGADRTIWSVAGLREGGGCVFDVVDSAIPVVVAAVADFSSGVASSDRAVCVVGLRSELVVARVRARIAHAVVGSVAPPRCASRSGAGCVGRGWDVGPAVERILANVIAARAGFGLGSAGARDIGSRIAEGAGTKRESDKENEQPDRWIQT